MDAAAARRVAARWWSLPEDDPIEVREVDGLWRAWRPGRTSVSLVLGDAGGVLAYHIAQTSDEEALAAYREGRRSEKRPELPPVPSTPETREALEASRERIRKLLKPYRR